MKARQNDTVVGVFTDRTHAERAVEALHQAGFTDDQIAFLTPDAPSGVEAPPLPHPGTKVEEGAATGATAGAALGGLVGAALATAAIPGVGPVIAGGLFTGALAGAVTGLAGGGIVGALIGLQVPEDEARHYEREFHSGRTLVTVRAGGRFEDAAAILRTAAEGPEMTGHAHARGSLSHLAEGDHPGASDGAGSAFVPQP
jgi:hypothetical protein